MKLLRLGNGVLLTLLLIAYVEHSRASGIAPPIPFLLLYMSVVYSAYVGGLLAGLVSAGLASGFIVYCSIISFGPSTLTGGPAQVTLGIVLHVLTAFLIGRITSQHRNLIFEIKQHGETLEAQVVKRTEKLAESEERFRNLVEGSIQGVFIHRADSPLFANQAYADILGYDSPEDLLVAGSVNNHVAPHEIERLYGYEKARLSGQSSVDQYEFDAVRKDGTIVTLQNVVRVVDWHGRRAIQSTVIDITVRKQVEKELRESERRYRRAAKLTNMGHWVWDINEDRCSYCSEELADIYGVSVEEYLHRATSLASDLEWYHPDDRQHCENIIREAIRNKTGYTLTARIVRDDGQVRYIQEVSDGILDADGNLVQTAGATYDITERKQAEVALAYQATHDNLTGLLNRYEMERRLARVLETTGTSQGENAFCYLDLDQFKVVNDTCGHMAGDELLRQLGQLLSETVRKRDTLARLGGDEFGVLMEHCTLVQARRVANKMRKAIANFHFAWEEKAFRIGVSIGLVPITEANESVASILSAADSACYAAKEGGRNRVHVYELDDTELALRQGEMQWVARINQGLEDNRFQLWQQPIVPVNSKAGEGEHFELLLRFVDEQGETVPPGAFLPAAERYGLSTKIDQWVIETAFDWLNHSPKLLEQLHLCCINLSGNSLVDEEFLVFVQEQLNNSQVPARKICFEVTETAAIANLSKAISFMTVLKKQGCKFALDDFGSGLSSFAYLKNLPVDYLKIDGAFVKDIVDDEVDQALVRMINDVGQVMGKRTIAEFVENDAILGILQEIGVDYTQGHGIGSPTPISEPTTIKELAS